MKNYLSQILETADPTGERYLEKISIQRLHFKKHLKRNIYKFYYFPRHNPLVY